MGNDLLHLEIVSEAEKGQANLTVIGVGGAGGNAVRRMIEASLTGVSYVVANTDAQALRSSPSPVRLQIGEQLTGGLGSGGNPKKGRQAAEESREKLQKAVTGADMVFIAAGMGGGTGTGASPLVASLAKEAGALTVAIVTRPFAFEGQPRMRVAEEGLRELREHVDTLIVIPNQRLLSIAGEDTTYPEAMRFADDVLVNATRGITDIILRAGDINVDFADVRAVMENRGNALMGCGRASGPNRAVDAASSAIASPLLNDVSIDGAEAILVNITGGDDMTLHQVAQATSVITDAAGDQADVIFGTVVDPNMRDQMTVTLIATGFGNPERRVLPIKDREGRSAERVAPPLPVGLDLAEPILEPQPTMRAVASAGDPGEARAEVADPAPATSTGAEPRSRTWFVSRDRPVFLRRSVED
jgi:cell division protein FtsZ